ncbi:hypothetical protein KOR42_43190 [Thalassoglobus neptunius]|uniref:Uncharacterized protein n=1 Tax=Thalassoglobus neptunius TaxID=1938619 RepID=A0A5C5W9V7_9PLAN|nr:hypothetical protein KOR42_43190 [Thalassoglobus neptunius]
MVFAISHGARQTGAQDNVSTEKSFSDNEFPGAILVEFPRTSPPRRSGTFIESKEVLGRVLKSVGVAINSHQNWRLGRPFATHLTEERPVTAKNGSEGHSGSDNAHGSARSRSSDQLGPSCPPEKISK